MRARFSIALACSLLVTALGGVRPAAAATGQVVLVSQDEGLMAYDIDAGVMHTFIEGGHGPTSAYLNGPPCFIPGDRAGRFVEADDNPYITWDGGTKNGDNHPFFGVFNKDGSRVTTGIGDEGRIGGEAGMPDPAGCAFDASGNLFGVDVGTIHAPILGDGQLVEFFAPDYTTWCTLDNALAQPGMVAFDAQNRLYVPEAGFGQIDRYSKFPTDAAHCSTDRPTKEVWMHTLVEGIGTPIGITAAPGGGFAVSSVLVLPAVYHVNDSGILDGVIALPGPATGTPFGLGYDNAGNLWWADLGVRPFPLDGTDPSDPIDAADGQGGFAVARAGGLPIAEQIASGWSFPDGVAVVSANAIQLSE